MAGEFLSGCNLLIEYIPGDDNADGDTLSRWAYPGGAAQDTNFHGSDDDALGWTEVARQEKLEHEKVLRHKYRDAFGSCTARTDIDGVVSMVALGDHGEQVRTLRACYQQARQQSQAVAREHFVMPDAMVTNEFSELVAIIHEDLSVHSSSDVPIALKEVTRSLNNLSWHTAGAECLAEASIHAVHEVHVPPDIHVLYQDWSKYYAKDKVYKKLWAELKTTEYVDDPKRDAYFLLQKGKIFHQGTICVPQAILSKVLAAVHSSGRQNTSTGTVRLLFLEQLYGSTKI